MALRAGIEAAFAAMHTTSQKLLEAIALTAKVRRVCMCRAERCNEIV